jgi:hypothetical protein
VQNYGINLDFDLFLRGKSGGPSPRAVDRARVAGPHVHHGPHSGRRPELTGAQPSGRSGAQQLVAEASEARGQRGDPSDGLILGGEAVRWASSGRQQSSVVTLDVRGARGEESWEGGVVWRGGCGVALCRLGEEGRWPVRWGTVGGGVV